MHYLQLKAQQKTVWVLHRPTRVDLLDYRLNELSSAIPNYQQIGAYTLTGDPISQKATYKLMYVHKKSQKPPLGKYIVHLSLFFVLTESHKRTLRQNMDKHLSMQAA